MAVTVRFAPSPTGRLHVGNVRTAILNWLFAKAQGGGTFMLRLDDTDVERSTEAFAEGIREDLRWLGLTWALEERQSARVARYEAAAEGLKRSGRLYPCYETEDELDRKRKRQLARGLPPIYDRSALKLSDKERAALEGEGRRPHWRFRLANSEEGLSPLPTIVSWNDLIRGDQTVDVGSLSDPILIRADGTFLYTFTSVVDDIDFEISHVIRGEDHVTNTGVQLQLFEALGKEPPAFGHHSLLIGADGHALSKRLGALSIESLRAAGLEPMAVASYTALIGTSDPIEPHAHLDDLARRFAFAKISTAPARFDLDELKALNARLLHKLPYEEVAPRLKAQGVGGGPEFWAAVRGNISVIEDAGRWWRIVSGDVAPLTEDRELTARAAALLPAEPWDERTWDVWIAALKAATGRKGRALFHPLRLALTGLEDGPELKVLLPLIGREKAERRLLGSAS